MTKQTHLNNLSANLIIRDGTVWGWGSNLYYNMGLGVSGSTSARKIIPIDGNVIDIVSSHYGTIFLLDDGTAWGCGNNTNSGFNSNTKTPQHITALQNVIKVAAGDDHMIAIEEDGKTWSWGRNSSGQLGLGYSSMASKATPQIIVGFRACDVVAGEGFTLLTSTDGEVFAFGRGTSGQLGQRGNSNAIVLLFPDSTTTPPYLDTEADSIAVTQVTVQAQLFNSSGDLIPAGDIQYTLRDPYAGVTVDSGTGVVTIARDAEPGVAWITAAHGSLSTVVGVVIGEAYTPTEPTPDPDPTHDEVVAAVNTLVGNGLIGNGAYWIQNYSQVSGLDRLLVRLAALDYAGTGVTVSTVGEAIDILAAAGAIDNPEYWRTAYSTLQYLDQLLINAASLVIR